MKQKQMSFFQRARERSNTLGHYRIAVFFCFCVERRAGKFEVFQQLNKVFNLQLHTNMCCSETSSIAPASLWAQSVRALFVFSLCRFTSGYSEKERADELMSRYPLIDGHNDLALQLRILHNNSLSRMNLYDHRNTATDINRLRAGRVQTQMFAAYVMCGAQQKDAVRLTLEQIDVVRNMCTKHNNDFVLVTSVQELQDSNIRNKIACLISIEGGHSIDSSLPALRMFYQLGVRSMSLTHTCNTPWAESSSKFYNYFQSRSNSLTQFGKAVVEEMNRLGMIVDLSHTSWDTASTVLNYSKAPVIFSHSSSYYICKHSRNVPDSLLHQLKKNRGLIMVTFYTPYVSCSTKANVSHVADHFDHIKRVIGAESIGIGGDYDGASGFPQGLEDVSKYPAIIQELLRRKWTDDELANVLRRNFLRVFEEVEKVRDHLRSVEPSEAQIPLEQVQNPCRMVLKRPGSELRSAAELKSLNLLLLTSILLLALIFLD